MDKSAADEFKRIRDLIKHEQRVDAVESLKAFKRAHPSVPVPADIEKQLSAP